ncbi:MAG: MamI family restriction endonuclease [Candidatus Brennerbacteria bacterium]
MNKQRVLDFLKLHHEAFFNAKPYADETAHPAPSDSRAWSQILVSLITDIKGLAREKGADLADGSDVKAANTWGAIDTPRFNGVIKAGTKSVKAGKLEYLDDLPYLFFVLWDNEPANNRERCRVWAVRTQHDEKFRSMCRLWYKQRAEGKIISNNFQLHPPRGKNSDVFRNTCGNLNYPLLFAAEWVRGTYEITRHDPEVLKRGTCTKAD